MRRYWLRFYVGVTAMVAASSLSMAQSSPPSPTSVVIPTEIVELIRNPILQWLAGGTLLALTVAVGLLGYGLLKYGKDIKKLNEFETMTRLASLARTMSDNTEAYGKVQQRMDLFSKDIDKITEQLAQLKGGQDMALAARETVVQATASKAQIDEYWKAIEADWSALKQTLGNVAQINGVKANFMGQVGVIATMDKLLEKRAVQPETAEMVNSISGRWQYMFRRMEPREEWLNEAQVKSFRNASAEAKSRLLANT